MSVLLKCFITVTVALFFSCDNEDKGNKIRYYYRDLLSKNGYETFKDYLVITNYKDGTLTIKQFADIAKSYLDTVKAIKPVDGVTFVGEGRWTKLPKAGWDYFDEQKKYMIISLMFDRTANKKISEVSYIGIFGNKYNSFSNKEVDSLLAIKEPLRTGF